jgi:hypothetical protein
MKRIVRCAAVLVAILCIVSSGCYKVIRIDSRVDPAFEGRLGRVFVVSHLSAVSERFARESHVLLEDAFRHSGIDAQIVTVDPLMLDERSYLTQMALFDPDSLLSIQVTARGGRTAEKISMATLDVSIYDVATDTRYWRATVDVKSGDVGAPMGRYTAEKLCEELVDRLHADGLISTLS